MPSCTIRTNDDLQAAYARLATVKLPLTLEWQLGINRTNEQNNLAHVWYAEISAQRGDTTPLQVKAEVKGYCGVQMMRAESDYFRARYDAATVGRTHEEKLLILEVFPVTSLMKVKQMVRYMDAAWQRYTSDGFTLTNPDDDLSRYMQSKRDAA